MPGQLQDRRPQIKEIMVWNSICYNALESLGFKKEIEILNSFTDEPSQDITKIELMSSTTQMEYGVKLTQKLVINILF